MASAPSIIAIIPARAGSKRVADKNIRPVAGHPMLAYSIAGARQSGIFQRILVSSDSDRYAAIARHYGAEAPFLRPPEMATSTSPDIEFLRHVFANIPDRYDCFSILRPTSPFRQGATIRRAWAEFLAVPNADSLRAVELCHEHPGKMWTLEPPFVRPLLDQTHLEVPWYDSQYQALARVYVQNSALEIAWTRVIAETGTKGGKNIVPFFTDAAEGLSVDYEDDWLAVERMIEKGTATLPEITETPFFGDHA
jgi:N-acylneuraminate cytidylyltransferase